MKDNYTKEEKEHIRGLFTDLVNEYKSVITDTMTVTVDQVNTFLKEKGLLEEPFKEGLQKGQWYKDENVLFCLTDGDDFNWYGYGFCMGEWNNDDQSWIPNEKVVEPATKEEVEKALIKEAERRGFKKGTTIVGWDINKTHNTIKGASYTYYKEHTVNSLWLGNTMLFERGTWAEIVEEKEEETIDELYDRKIEEALRKHGLIK